MLGSGQLCLKSPNGPSSLCSLCVLCVSVVDEFRAKHTTETQRTQRFHREISKTRTFEAKPWHIIPRAEKWNIIAFGFYQDARHSARSAEGAEYNSRGQARVLRGASPLVSNKIIRREH